MFSKLNINNFLFSLADPLIEDLENRWRQDENFRMFFVEKEAKVITELLESKTNKTSR